MAACPIIFGTMDWLSDVALKMAKVAIRGSMGYARNEEGRMALVASKQIAIALMWASLVR